MHLFRYRIIIMTKHVIYLGTEPVVLYAGVGILNVKIEIANICCLFKSGGREGGGVPLMIWLRCFCLAVSETAGLIH